MNSNLRLAEINHLISAFEEAQGKKKLHRKDKKRLNTQIVVFQTFDPIFATVQGSCTQEEQKHYEEREEVLIKLGKQLGFIK